MNKSILLQYADLERQRRDIEAQQSALKETIIADLQAAELEKAVVQEAGVFTLVKRKLWKYSREVFHLQEVLEELQDDERHDGRATFEEKVTVAFYPNKE